MNIYEFFPVNLLIEAAYWLVTTLSTILEPIAGVESAAAAIVLLTLSVRALLIPVGRSQLKASIARQRLAPQIAELRRRHRKNPELLQRKTMELYAREKASPFAGCLPVLAQTPVLMAVYGLFILPRIGGHANDLLTHTFLGVPLDASLAGQIGAGAMTGASAAVFATIMVLIAIVAYFSRRLLAPASLSPEAALPQQEGAPNLAGLMRALSFLPFLTAVFAGFVPLAAALYLLTTVMWTLGERLILQRTLGATASA